MEKKYVYNQPLIKNLKKHNYKFLWFGNSLMNCSMYNQDFCFDNNKKSIFAPSVYYGFFKQSPLIKIYKKVKSKLNSTKCSYSSPKHAQTASKFAGFARVGGPPNLGEMYMYVSPIGILRCSRVFAAATRTE